jgi:hypothetical protein
MRTCANSRQPIGTKFGIMSNIIKITNKQIKTLKDMNSECLLSFSNVPEICTLGFSHNKINLTIDEKIKLTKKYEELNKIYKKMIIINKNFEKII